MSSYGPVWHFPNFFRIGKKKGKKGPVSPLFRVLFPLFTSDNAEKWGMVT